MSETVQACPDEDCESSDVHPQAGNVNQDTAPDSRWRCSECGNEFDTPIRRPPRNGSTHPPTHSVASKLSAMDPDDLGGSA